VVPLSNATSASRELKNIFAATRKDADSDAIRFMAVSRLNAVMIIARSPHYLESTGLDCPLDRSRNSTSGGFTSITFSTARRFRSGKAAGVVVGADIQFRTPGTSPADGSAAPAADGAQVGAAVRAADARHLRPNRRCDAGRGAAIAVAAERPAASAAACGSSRRSA